ncbi:hypothetical protein [Xylanibacillus composti]|uniref:hypothetical protein n=1 Tax=Xylanibacillus composti TaxID=1572762 RepID=UPI001BCCAF14|nr:hypothetical protein [Xylanibacillus composti]
MSELLLPEGWNWLAWLLLWGWTGTVAALAAWSVPRFLAAHRLTAANFRKQLIPLGSGMAVWVTVAAHCAFLSLFAAWWQGTEVYGSLAIAGTAVFFAGWLDDTVGDVKVKGLRGHWQAFRHNAQVTTGALKALSAAAAAAWIGALVAGPIPPIGGWAAVEEAGVVLIWLVRWLLAFLLMCLSANTLNLLDLRPGRALKGFFVLGVAALLGGVWQGRTSEAIVMLMPGLLAALCLFRQDIQARSMLGDSGVNLLGFLAGFALASCAPMLMQLLIVALLTFLHVAAERISLSHVIDRTLLLHWFDRLGRADRQP